MIDITDLKFMFGPCQKQTVLAFLVTQDGKRAYVGSNWCKTPVEPEQCPRVLQNYKSGEGYHLCRDICHQPYHAETDVLTKAGSAEAMGSKISIIGHNRVCEQCKTAMRRAGVKEWEIIK